MGKINKNDIVGQEVKEVKLYDEYITLKLANGVEYEASIDPDEGDDGQKYIGKTIEEFLPYHDGAEIKLSDGTSLDGALCGDFEEPTHPALINKIYDAMDDNKISCEDVEAMLDDLVGRIFKFNKKECSVARVPDPNDLTVEIYCSGEKGTKTINIYSLE